MRADLTRFAFNEMLLHSETAQLIIATVTSGVVGLVTMTI